jgi:acyl carrier protein
MPNTLAPLQAAFAHVLQATVNADPAAVTRGSRLREDLGINSLSMIEVACAAEDRFGVRVPDDDLERFVTVGDAVDFLHHALLQHTLLQGDGASAAAFTPS